MTSHFDPVQDVILEALDDSGIIDKVPWAYWEVIAQQVSHELIARGLVTAERNQE